MVETNDAITDVISEFRKKMNEFSQLLNTNAFDFPPNRKATGPPTIENYRSDLTEQQVSQTIKPLTHASLALEIIPQL